MYDTSLKWKENIYKNTTSVLNIYIDDVLINPDYVLELKKGGNVFEEELYLGSTPSQYIEMKIYKEGIIQNPSQIKIEYGILINNALTVAEVNTMLVGTLNGIQVKSLSKSNSSFEIIPIGIYNVDDYTDNDDNTITIKALDNMIKFENKYDGSKLIYPATLLKIAQDICEKSGVELGSASFLNSNKQITTYDNQITAREYISYIAESAGGFACIGRDGKLYFKDLYQDETEIPTELLWEYKWGEEHQITKISYEDGVRSFKFGDDTGNNIWINQENMYIVDEKQIENIYKKLNGIIINSFEGKTVIDPAIDIGDKIIIDGKAIIYQGETNFQGRFIADIISKIEIKQKEETTVKEQSQKIINRRVQSRIDEQEGKIKQLVEETSENSQKLSQHEQTIDSITQKVENIEDVTNTVESIKTIRLENCADGNLLELHIYGNNTVFDYLYPNNDLYPSNELYPYGDSRIVVYNTTQGSEEIAYSKEYELGVLEVLRQNGEVFDEYVLENGHAKIIRRVNKDGTTKAEETIENLGEFKIPLREGDNYIEIKNYTAKLKGKFAVKNTYTDRFATKVEMKSSIEQTAEEINLEVRKKVDENEIVSKINQSAEQITIEAEKLNLNGAISANGNFKIDKEGNLEANSGKFKGRTFSYRGK